MTSAHRLTGRFIAGVTSAVTAVALLAACQPSEGASTPPPAISPILPTESTATSPAPSTSAIPSPSVVVTTRPTTPEETAALVAEAEWVYREMQRLVDEYEGRGGAATLPEPLKAYVGGDYAVAAEKSLQHIHGQDGALQGRTAVHRGPIFTNGLKPTSLIGVEFCNDMTVRTIVVDGQTPRPVARFVSNGAEFSRGNDGRLRMTANKAEEVTSCVD